MILVAFRQPQARVISQTRGTDGEMSNRRDNPGSLIFVSQVPQLVHVPWPGVVTAGNGLKRHLPTAVAAGNNVNQARAVAHVRIVIDSEQIPVLIKRQFMGVT